MDDSEYYYNPMWIAMRDKAQTLICRIGLDAAKLLLDTFGGDKKICATPTCWPEVLVMLDAALSAPAPSMTPTLDKLEAERAAERTMHHRQLADWQLMQKRAEQMPRPPLPNANLPMVLRDNRDRTPAETDFRIRQLAAQIEATAKEQAMRGPKTCPAGLAGFMQRGGGLS